MILNSYRATRRECGDLENLIVALKDSNEHVKNIALNKLDVIGEHIKFLQNQAKEILEEAAKNSQLHKIPCNFVKVPGTIYHLYQRPQNGEKIWSMLSPEEFGSSCKNTYLGSYRMEPDKSFTSVDCLDEYADKREFAESLIQSRSKNLPALEFMTKKKERKESEVES